MTNPDNVGGLPKLPEPSGYMRELDGGLQYSAGPIMPPNRAGGYATPWAAVYSGLDMKRELEQADALCRRLARELDSARSELRDVWAAMPKHELFLDPPDGGDVPLAEQVRRLGESHKQLCRAAPAGGDVSSTWEYGCDAPRNGGAPYIGATIGGHFVRFRIEDDFADAVKRHTFLRTLQSHLNAAPAGGDVAVGEIGELNGTKLIVGRDEDALARLPKGTKLYTRPQDSAPAGGDYPNEADGLALELVSVTEERDFLRRRVAELSAPAGSGEVERDNAETAHVPRAAYDGLLEAIDALDDYFAEDYVQNSDFDTRRTCCGAHYKYPHKTPHDPSCTVERVRSAAALLRKLQQGADGWRPIDSAPKDGSLFLCWVDAVRYGERDDGSFDTADCSDVDFCQWRDSEHGGYFMNMMGDIGDGQNITHWRPLPTRPASQGQEGGK